MRERREGGAEKEALLRRLRGGIIALAAGLVILWAVPRPVAAVSEEQLPGLLSDRLLPFYEQGLRHARFIGRGGVEIACAILEVENERGALIILPGRREYGSRYAEVLYDLRSAGYSLYIMDHRGQGLSGRMLPDPAKGHVEMFGDYVADLGLFIDQVVNARPHARRFVLAHSMGGLIAALYALERPGMLDGMFFCSPMVAIEPPVHPRFLTVFTAVFMDSVGLGRVGVPFAHLFAADYPFEKNWLTHSRIRYEMHANLVRRDPRLLVGAPTFGWLRQSMNAGNILLESAAAVKTPMLIRAAAEDRLVSVAAQEEFCAAAPNCRLEIIPGAYHELLMEEDPVRDRVLHSLLDFLEQLGREDANATPSGEGFRQPEGNP